ncbi:hypothetical protein [Streptomyces microflavus]|uniref:hypothetical protein n=1 Tax=Streptomyces microflavus TaxID=1919 RepID=UPI0033B88CAD
MRRAARLPGHALRIAAEHPGACPRTGFDTDTAAAILTRLDARSSRSSTGSDSKSDDEDPEADAAEVARLHRIAPTLMRRLPMTKARALGAHLSDEELTSVEGLAYDSDVARLQANAPLTNPLLDDILTRLSEHPDFTGAVQHSFSLLVTQTLLFLKSRADLTRTSLLGPTKDGEPPFDYRRKPEGKQRTANEGDVQRDFHQWLLAGPLNGVVQVEITDVGMGRADVMVRFGALRYLTEMKQDSDDSSRTHIENKYLTQEAEYTNAGAPFGQLIVLDLTPKSTAGGTLRIDELTWVASHRPTGAPTERLVLAGIVTGNRITPSAYSR